MPTRNVVLSDHQHELVEDLVQSGRYQNASDVLREGLRLIEQRERLEAARLQTLLKDEALALSEADRAALALELVSSLDGKPDPREFGKFLRANIARLCA